MENVIDLIKTLFYDNYEDIIMVSIDEREKYPATDAPIKRLKSIRIKDIDGIIVNDDKIYIKYNYHVEPSDALDASFSF